MAKFCYGKQLYILYSIGLFIAALVFWTYLYDGHLHYQEWFQLFQDTSSYFEKMLLLPGGVTAWISQWMTQFFCNNIAGGIICAIIIVSIGILTFFIAGEKTLFSFAISVCTSLIVWILMSTAGISLTMPIQLFVILAVSLVFYRSGIKGKQRMFVIILTTPVMWFICGSMTFVYIVAVFSFPNESLSTRLLISVCQVILLLCCCFIYSLFSPYLLKRVALGFYYTNMNYLTPLVIVGCVLACLFIFVASLRVKVNDILSFILLNCLIAVSGYLINLKSDFRMEMLLDYSHLVHQERWDEIIRKNTEDGLAYDDVHIVADKKGVRWYINDAYSYRYACVSLAYAKKGVLLDNMFSYFCPGPDGLIPKYDGEDFLKNVFSSDVFFNLSMINRSQHAMFEAMETTPDFQKGLRMYERLAVTNYINDYVEVSNKYLYALSKTYKGKEFAESFLDNENVKHVKKIQDTFSCSVIMKDDLTIDLFEVSLQDSSNPIASQYLLAYTMLNKNLNVFEDAVESVYGASLDNLPNSVQQALMLVYVSKENFTGTFPPFISLENIMLGRSFMTEYEKMEALPKYKYPSFIQKMLKKYGDSYFFYYYLHS